MNRTYKSMSSKTAGIHITRVSALLILLILLPLSSHPAEIDPAYLDDKSSCFIVKPYAGFTFTSFSFEYDSDDDKEISYTSRPSFTGGLSLAWKFLGISAGIRKPLADDEYSYAENEESFDLRVNYYGRYFGCDLNIQHQKGFFLEDDDDDTDPLTYYDNVVLNNASLSLYYIFSWDTFSMRASYDGTDIQKKTSSSFLLRAAGGIFEVKSSSSLLLDDSEPALYRTHGLDYCSQKYISLSPGYGWTIVFGGNYYFNTVLFLGMGVQRSLYRSDSGEYSKWTIIPDTDLKMAVGYSSERFFYGFSVIAAMHISHLDSDIDTSCILVNSVFHAGYRFF